jgi:hypothetical protein
MERSLSLFPEVKHTLILDHFDSVYISSPNVNLVKNVSKVLESETLRRNVDLEFRKGYWNFTLERIFAVLDYQIKNNVTYAINFMSVKWSDNMYFFTNCGGKVSLFKNNKNTKLININIPNTTHTSIDNTVHNYIIKIVNNFIKNNSQPIDFVKKYKYKS